MHKIGLVIHGGAGNFTPESINEAERAARLDTLNAALNAGYAVLQQNGAAMDAAQAAVVILEDCPLFNAGRGSVLTADGTVEMDAAIMDGASGRCGGVSAVRTIKNPVRGARAVMEESPHTLLCGSGAESFAQIRGLEIAPNDYFQTPERRDALTKILADKKFEAAKSLGTVGAVARDQNGNLAAATSTGGLTGKLPGRVSDSSIAGAGNWADNKTCALSCTGTGDVFIQCATARDIACMMEYKKMNLCDAVREGLQKVAFYRGSGGIIGIASDGAIVMEYNTTAMFRGYKTDDKENFTAIF